MRDASELVDVYEIILIDGVNHLNGATSHSTHGHGRVPILCRLRLRSLRGASQRRCIQVSMTKKGSSEYSLIRPDTYMYPVPPPHSNAHEGSIPSR